MAEDLQVEIETLDALDEKEQKEKIMQMLNDIDSNEDELYEHFLESLDIRPTVYEIKRYVQAYAKYGEKETYRRTKVYPGIKLMTAHSSKGLEWPVVFNDIDGYESNFLKPGIETNESEEARRLFFVSSTRARERASRGPRARSSSRPSWERRRPARSCGSRASPGAFAA